jgi:hypothetical protein
MKTHGETFTAAACIFRAPILAGKNAFSQKLSKIFYFVLFFCAETRGCDSMNTF